MTLATDKPRFTITLAHRYNEQLELSIEETGDSKSQIIEKALGILYDLSENDQKALYAWAEEERRSPEMQIRLILEKALEQWAVEKKKKKNQKHE